MEITKDFCRCCGEWFPSEELCYSEEGLVCDFCYRLLARQYKEDMAEMAEMAEKDSEDDSED